MGVKVAANRATSIVSILLKGEQATLTKQHTKHDTTARPVQGAHQQRPRAPADRYLKVDVEVEVEVEVGVDVERTPPCRTVVPPWHYYMLMERRVPP